MARFGPPDIEKDEQEYRDYFASTIFPDDAKRDADEDALRDAMFEKLSDLSKVVEDVKKGLKKRK